MYPFFSDNLNEPKWNIFKIKFFSHASHILSAQ